MNTSDEAERLRLIINYLFIRMVNVSMSGFHSFMMFCSVFCLFYLDKFYDVLLF